MRVRLISAIKFYLLTYLLIMMSRNDDIASCFDRLDTDGNGVLTPDEIASILQERLGFDAE